MRQVNKLLDTLSDFLAHRKGLLPLVGIALVLVNFFVGLLLPGWLAQSDLLLHLGVIVAVLGFMLAWAL